MSTFTGTVGDTDRLDLQLAPTGSDGPDFGELKKGFEETVASAQPFADQCFENFRSRFCLWAGQSADGKKHARAGNGQVDIVPWDGASDLRVYQVDDAVNSYVSLFRMAFKRASLVADPIEANDYKQSKIVSNFMKWLIHTQIPNVDREVELLANYVNEHGIGAMGVFWETKQEKKLATITLQEIQQKFPDVDMRAVLADAVAADQVAAIFEEQYGCTGAKAKKMVRELGTRGKTTVATLGRLISRPVLRAFNLTEQLFVASDTTDEEAAAAIYRVEYFSPEQLRSLVNTDGWDGNWVEKAIENCRGKILSLSQSEYLQPLARSFIYQQQQQTNKIGVVYAYQRQSDEDGVPGIYLTIFNPLLGPDATQEGYAKTGLFEYEHGQYPFIFFRREYLSRRLYDTRGMPEPGKSWQDAVKAHRDSRIDAASIAIIPPIGFPMGRPPSRWGPGARIPERRAGEFHFLDRPQGDPLTEQSEQILRDTFNDYFGFLSKEGDPADAQNKRQNATDKFLSCLSAVFNQVFELNRQYGDPEVTFRVLGMKDAEALTFVKGDSGQYNFFFTWDVQSADAEKMQMKWKAILEGIQLLNRDGNVNFATTIQAYIESIDPVLAEKILDPTSVGQDKVIKEENNDLAQIFAGIPAPIKIGTPPQLGLQTMQQYIQNAPDVQQRLQTDEAFRTRIETRMKQYQMQLAQQSNRLVGVYGALQPGQTQ